MLTSLQNNASDFRNVLRSGTAIAAILLGTCNHAIAADDLDASLSGLAPVSAEELGANRGGFSIGPVSISIGFTLATSVTGGSLGSGVTVTTNFTVSSPGNLENLGTTIKSAVNSNLENAGVTTLADDIKDSVDASLVALSNGLANGTNAEGEAASSLGGAAEVAAAAGSTGVADAAAPSGAGATSSFASLPTSEAPSSALPSTPVADAGSLAGGAAAPVSTPVANLIANSTGAAPTAPAEAPIAPAPGPTTPVASQFTAQFDTANGSVALTAGGTNILLQALQGQLSLIQNSDNNVHIENKVTANYIIENYKDIAALSNMHQQISDLANQMLSLYGIGH